MRKYVFLALLVTAALHSMVFTALGAERLTLLHVNDLHGSVSPRIEKAIDRTKPVGGAAYLAAMIKTQRAADPAGVILLAAGDMFQGTPVSDLFQGRPVLDVMNSLRFDAMVLGNHEFDWGPGPLQGIIKGGRFPFLSANTVDRAGNYLPGVRPYVVLERKGIKVAVIGLTTPETASIVRREHVADLRFPAPEKVLPRLLREVRQKGATLVVLLTHLGLDDDMRLAAAVPGIDVIVGGHSHTVLVDPVRVGRTIIVQAGAHGLYLGVLKITVDEKTGRIEAATEKGELRPVWAGPNDAADEETARIVDRYRAKIRAVMGEVVGETRVDLTRRPDRESNLGDVIADAMRESSGSQVAIQNSGGIRADIPAGRITMEQVYTALPFDDALVCMDLAGDALLDIFEKAGAHQRGLLQVSGLKVAYAVTADGRKRVKGISVGGMPLDKSRTYRVVTNDFLASGGDGLAGFRKGSRVAAGAKVRDAFVDYLRRRSPVGAPEGKRIAITGEWGRR